MNKAFEKIYSNSPIFIQNYLLQFYGNKIKNERFCPEYHRWIEFLDKSERFSSCELIEYQNDRLRILIKYCYDNVPYYRNLMDSQKLKPDDIQKIEDLPKLPILTPELIKRNFPTLIARNYKIKQLREGHTSGTTGTPRKFLWDTNIEVATNAFLWRARKWARFEFGEPYATLLGRTIVPLKQKAPPFWRYNKPWNQYLFSSFHLEAKNLPYYFEAFERFKIKHIEAYPSTIYILAKYLESIGNYYPVESIVTSSETLLDIQREVIEERFQCKLFDYYCQAERVAFSSECECHNGHHLHTEYGIVEILDENDNVLPYGSYGKIIATGLHNFGMPLIRYEIGDNSAYKLEKCSCGRNFPLLQNVTTKAEDIVVTSDGRLISSSILTHPFKPLDNIHKSQIIQENNNKIIIKIVKKEGYSENDTLALLAAIKERIGNEMRITVKFVDDIPRDKSGKYRWVISKVPIKYGNKTFNNLFTSNRSQ